MHREGGHVRRGFAAEDGLRRAVALETPFVALAAGRHTPHLATPLTISACATHSSTQSTRRSVLHYSIGFCSPGLWRWVDGVAQPQPQQSRRLAWCSRLHL